MTETRSFRLVFDPVGELLAAARACEEEVFGQTYGNTREELLLEYGPYEDATVFLAVADEQDEVIAACRLITPGPAGLKSLNDAASESWCVDSLRAARAAGLDPARTWDVATLGVSRGRGATRLLTAAALYHGIAVATRVNRIRSSVMIMDERARRLLSAVGIQTFALPGTHAAPYLGSPASTPLYLHWAGMLDNQRRTNPEGFRLVGEGLGLDVRVPVPDAFRLRERVRSSDVSPLLGSAV